MNVFDNPENKPPDKPVPESGFVAENENPPVAEEDSRPDPENEPEPAEPLDAPKSGASSRAKPKSAAARAKAKREAEAKVAAQPDPPDDVEPPEGERKYGGWTTEGPQAEVPHDDDEFDEYAPGHKAADREPGEPAPEDPTPEPKREWSMEGDVRLLVDSTPSDVYALVHGLEADVQTDVGEQIEACRLAVVRLLEAGALGGQDKTVHVKLCGFANPGNEPGEGTKDRISIEIEQVESK